MKRGEENYIALSPVKWDTLYTNYFTIGASFSRWYL